MSDEMDVVIIKQYFPPGVKEIIGTGTFSYIGVVDESTVLKYPHVVGQDLEQQEIEIKLLEQVCPHPRIIQLKGHSESGIYLERATNGSLADYLLEPDRPPSSISTQQRVSWCREAAEAVAHIHSRRFRRGRNSSRGSSWRQHPILPPSREYLHSRISGGYFCAWKHNILYYDGL